MKLSKLQALCKIPVEIFCRCTIEAICRLCVCRVYVVILTMELLKVKAVP
jgi:hypothetical protein